MFTTKNDYLHSLYKSHVADFKSVYPDEEDLFVCPICLRMFPEYAIDEGYLTDGHIWPADMRKISKVANDQGVLLCRDCNNSAGSRGDVQMQLYEKIKLTDKNGELYGIRTVQLIVNPGEKPIQMRVNVSKKDDTTFTITGRLNKKKQWLGSSPEDHARFLDITNRSMETQQRFSVIVNQPKEFKPNLVSAGWITSAYLMAFYTFGYRYILHTEFNFIREYIQSSFDPDLEKTLVLPATEDFHIYTSDEVNFPDPAIRISIPVNSDQKVRLEVCFLKYEVSLPLLLDSNIFKGLWSIISEQLRGQQLPPVKEGESACVYLFIHCSKTVVHDCIYDYLLGKPLSNL